MNNFKEEILKFKCPRWDSLPEVDLYMDQVVSLLENKLHIFADEEKIVTSTMINNYVKQKIIPAPHQKRYSKNQVAHLFIIILLKKIFSVSEISMFLSYIDEKNAPEKSFDEFCNQVEYCISMLFGSPDTLIQTTAEDKITESVAFAFACKLFAQTLLKERNTEESE